MKKYFLKRKKILKKFNLEKKDESGQISRFFVELLQERVQVWS